MENGKGGDKLVKSAGGKGVRGGIDKLYDLSRGEKGKPHKKSRKRKRPDIGGQLQIRSRRKKDGRRDKEGYGMQSKSRTFQSRSAEGKKKIMGEWGHQKGGDRGKKGGDKPQLGRQESRKQGGMS